MNEIIDAVGTLGEIAATFRYTIVALLIILLWLVAWPRIALRLRAKLFRTTFGDFANDFPELELFMLRLLASSKGSIGLSELMQFLLLRRPSKRVRKLLAAYSARPNKNFLHVNDATTGDVSEEVLRLLIRACLMLRVSRPTASTVEDTDVLVTLFGAPDCAAALERLGLSKLRVTYYLSHGQALPSEAGEILPLSPIPDHVWVRIDNDDYSEMDLVTQILRDVFEFNPEDASTTMSAVHRYGSVSLGPYAHDEGLLRAKKAIEMARAAQAPLKFSMTPKPPTLKDLVTDTATMSEFARRNPYATPRSMSDRLDT